MEYFDVVDETGTPTGRIVERGTAHREGILHRTAQIWVIRREGDKTMVLLQRRAAMKESYPNCLDTSSAGHIHAGDEILPSALRELEEELGIRVEVRDLIPVGAFRGSVEKEFHGSIFKDEEVSFVHVYEKEIDSSALHLQEEEVSEVLWIEYKELVRRIEAEDPELCPERGALRLLGSYLGEKVIPAEP